MNKPILKYTALVLFTFSLAFTGCKKDDKDEGPKPELKVPTTTIPIINKFTATWCEPCGKWGWDLMEDLVTNYDDRVLIMGSYSSPISKMFNPTAEVFQEQFGQGLFFWPTFTVNGRDISQSTTPDSAFMKTKAKCVERLDEFFTTTAYVQTGYRYTVKDGKINVETKTEFFEDAEGEYYLGVYVIEDGVIEEQNTRGPSASHHYVFRDTKQEFAWGKQIFKGEATKGTTIDNNFTINVEPEWNMNNVQVVTILWDLNEWGYYLFVNANKYPQQD